MIDLVLPEPLMLALRWALLLCPLALMGVMLKLRAPSRRLQIGALFAFLYGVPIVFITHMIAIELGWWHYGWDALMLNGLPADILIGGSILFGPALFLAFPNTRPLLLCLPIVLGLHGTLFSTLQPLVFAGDNWFWGVIFVFAFAHVPAIYLAKWTAGDSHLPLRCALLAIMTGGLIFAIVPSLVMQAMGGEWRLFDRSTWSISLTLAALCLVSAIGLSANQTLCLQGRGTPIPLDPTQRLVTTGIYAYVSNPMQLSAALAFLVIGVFVMNIWIMAAALMAWIFVQGMVRWHHRHDLLKRFPDGWPEYKNNVPEWRPRWTPWIKGSATLHLPAHLAPLRRIFDHAEALTVIETPGPARFEHTENVTAFQGTAAVFAAFAQVNFGWMLVSATVLVPLLALQHLVGLASPKRAQHP